ncbi:unnamed protein product, partial [Candidula unifasciata]
FLKFIIWGILGSILAILGFLGNTLSMVVLYRRQMRSSTSYYLISLAIYDNGILLGMVAYFCLPSIAPYSSLLTHYQTVSSRTIIFGYPLSLVAHMGSIYTCVGFTVERFIAVCWPLQAANTCTRSRTARVILFIFLWSLIYNIPRFFHYELQDSEEEDASKWNITESVSSCLLSRTKCSEMYDYVNATKGCAQSVDFNLVVNTSDTLQADSGSSSLSINPGYTQSTSQRPHKLTNYKETQFGAGDTFKHIYLIYFQLVFMFLLPFVAILAMNFGLVQTARGSKFMQQATCVTARKEQNLAIMLIAVTAVFLICQFPTIIDNILVAVVGENKLQQNNTYVCFWIICTLMVEINAASNFLLYCFFGKKFRMMLLATLGFKKKYHQVTYRSTVSRFRLNGNRMCDMEVSAL